MQIPLDFGSIVGGEGAILFFLDSDLCTLHLIESFISSVVHFLLSVLITEFNFLGVNFELSCSDPEAIFLAGFWILV